MTDRYGETILLQKDLERGTWTYSSDRDPLDRGSVVDFLVRRDGASSDTSINRLVACVDRSNKDQESLAYREALLDRDNVLHRAEARHIAAITAERDAARDLERLGVHRGALDEWRFGPPSIQLRHPSTLEHSRYRPSDREMVFVERPIDAIGYEQRHGRQHACYVYTGDRPDSETKRKIAHLLADAPEGLRVVVAFARDRRGVALAEEVMKLASTRETTRQAPEFGSRWSDQMQIEQRHQSSRNRLAPDAARTGQPDPQMEAFRAVVQQALDAGVDVKDIEAVLMRRPGQSRAARHIKTAIVRRPSRAPER
jgi:hypothetical protein